MKSGLSFQRKFLTPLRDLAVLDQERAVAREPGDHHRALVEEADVEEVRDEDAALGAGDQLVHRLRAPDHLEHRRGSGRRSRRSCPPLAPPVGVTFFCLPVARVGELLSTPFSIHTVRDTAAPRRRTVGRAGRRSAGSE
jgi:hypothetical protein